MTYEREPRYAVAGGARIAPTSLVVGGSIARSWDLFADAFRTSCPPVSLIARCGVAERLDEAALLGAAFHAVRELDF